jgi:hypothetical protein
MSRIATALALVLAVSGELVRAQQGVFRGGITIVPIDVRAFDRRGKPVTDRSSSRPTRTAPGLDRRRRPNRRAVSSPRKPRAST